MLSPVVGENTLPFQVVSNRSTGCPVGKSHSESRWKRTRSLCVKNTSGTGTSKIGNGFPIRRKAWLSPLVALTSRLLPYFLNAIDAAAYPFFHRFRFAVATKYG